MMLKFRGIVKNIATFLISSKISGKSSANFSQTQGILQNTEGFAISELEIVAEKRPKTGLM